MTFGVLLKLCIFYIVSIPLCLCGFVFSVLGETLVNVLDCKKDMGMWHGVLTVRLNAAICTVYPD